MASKEKEVKKTMIITKKCRVKEYGEHTAKPVTPGLIVVVPIEDVGYLVGIKCAEIYTGDVKPGEVVKSAETKKAEKTSQEKK